jgi:hypothetical protein
LVLLPIFLPFVFVGCGVRFTEGAPIYFSYEDNLQSEIDSENPGIESFVVKFEFQGTIIGEVERIAHEFGGFPDPDTAITVGKIPLEEEGVIRCEGTVTLKAGGKEYRDRKLPKFKDDMPPSVRLARIQDPQEDELYHFDYV